MKYKMKIPESDRSYMLELTRMFADSWQSREK
jgi:hypothetical protein